MFLNEDKNELSDLELDEANKALEEELRKTFPRLFEEGYDLVKHKQHYENFKKGKE